MYTPMPSFSYPDNYIGKRLLCFCLFFLLCLVLYPQILTAGTYDLIFVQIPANTQQTELQAKRISSVRDRYVKNARIVLLNRDTNQIVNLTPEFYAACDPDVSFDARQIIFSGKRNQGDNWEIWRMNIDDAEKTQITFSAGDCMMPVYAGNRFYLDDPQPTPQIIYAGTIDSLANYQESQPVMALFGTDPEGKTTYQLTHNLYSDFSPDILPDGRIVFSSWQPSQGGKLALMAINNDGTDLMPYYGNHEKPLYKEMTHISDTDGCVYFIETDTLIWLGGGDIASLSQRRPLHSYKKVSKAKNGVYHSPCSLPEGKLIASWRKKTSVTIFEIYNINPETGDKDGKLYTEPGWHCIDMQLLAAHPNVKGRSNWLIPGSTSGVFYCLNSYQTNLPEDISIKPGEIKFVRILEGISRGEYTREESNPSEFKNDLSSHNSPRRILGTAPVENDGSFQVRVPAGMPLSFQVLDQNYLKLREQEGWIWVMGNENRGCIGCHEDRELSPPNILVKAVTKPAVDLTLPSEKRRFVDFRHSVLPIVERKCTTSGCHVTGNAHPYFKTETSAGKTNTDLDIYQKLLYPIEGKPEHAYVIPGSALKSRLIWHLFGKCLTSDEYKVTVIPPDHSLTAEEKLSFIEWIDLGAAWDLNDYRIHNDK